MVLSQLAVVMDQPNYNKMYQYLLDLVDGVQSLDSKVERLESVDLEGPNRKNPI